MGLVDDLLDLAGTGKIPPGLVSTSYVRIREQPDADQPQLREWYAAFLTSRDVRVDDDVVGVALGSANGQLAVTITYQPGRTPVAGLVVDVYVGTRTPTQDPAAGEYEFYTATVSASGWQSPSSPLTARAIAASARALPQQVVIRGLPVPVPATGRLDVAGGVDVLEHAPAPLAAGPGYVKATLVPVTDVDGATLYVVGATVVTEVSAVVVAEVADEGGLQGTIFDASVSYPTDPRPPAPAVRPSEKGAMSAGRYSYRTACVADTQTQRVGPAGAPSAVVAVDDDGAVTVTVERPDALPDCPVRVYRSIATDPFHWYEVGEVAPGDAAFEDTTEDAAVGAVAPPQEVTVGLTVPRDRTLHLEPRLRTFGVGLPRLTALRFAALAHTGAGVRTVAVEYQDPPPPGSAGVVFDTANASLALVESAVPVLPPSTKHQYRAAQLRAAGLPPWVGVTTDLEDAARSLVEMGSAPPGQPPGTAIGGIELLLSPVADRLPVPRQSFVVERGGKAWLWVACSGLRHARYVVGTPHTRATEPEHYAGDGRGQWVEVLQSDRADFGREYPYPRVTPRSLRLFLANSGSTIDIRAIEVTPLHPDVPVLADVRADDDLPLGLLVTGGRPRGVQVRTEGHGLLPLVSSEVLVARAPHGPERLRLDVRKNGESLVVKAEPSQPTLVTLDRTERTGLAVSHVAGRVHATGPLGEVTVESLAGKVRTVTFAPSGATLSGRLSIASGVWPFADRATAVRENQQVRIVDHGVLGTTAAARVFGLARLALELDPIRVDGALTGTPRSLRVAGDGQSGTARAVFPAAPPALQLSLVNDAVSVILPAPLSGGWFYLARPVDHVSEVDGAPSRFGESLVAFDVVTLPSYLGFEQTPDSMAMFPLAPDDFAFSGTRVTVRDHTELKRLLIGSHAKRVELTVLGGGIGAGPDPNRAYDEWSLAAATFARVTPLVGDVTFGLWAARQHGLGFESQQAVAVDARSLEASIDADAFRAYSTAAEATAFRVATGRWVRRAEMQMAAFSGMWRIGAPAADDMWTAPGHAGDWWVRAITPTGYANDAYFGTTPGTWIAPNVYARKRIYYP